LKNHLSKSVTKQYKTTLMQNRFLNYYFFLKLASYKQQQPFLVDKLTCHVRLR